MRSSNQSLSNAKAFLLIVFAIVVSLCLSMYYQYNQIIGGDQEQMIVKGLKAAIEGVYLPYGNASSVLGNVPGSLLSYLVGYPLSLYNNPLSPIVLLLLIRFLGVLIFINALSLIFSKKTVVIGTILYTLSPWFLYDNIIYNPAYLSFGSALFLNALIRLRTTNKRRISSFSVWFYSLILTLSIGICFQLHFSFFLLFLIALILFLRKNIKISFIGVGIGAAIIIASLIPYIYAIMADPSLLLNEKESDRYIGYGFIHVYPLLKSILYWLKFSSLLISNKAILTPFDIDGSISLNIIYYLYLSLVYVIGAITLILSAYFTYSILSISRFHQNQGVNFTRSLTIASLLGLLIVSSLSPITFSYWHLIIIFPLSLMPFLAFIERKNNRIKFSLLIFVSVIMLIMNLISASSSEKFSISTNYVDQANRVCLLHYDYTKCNLKYEYAQQLLTSREFIDAQNSKLEQDSKKALQQQNSVVNEEKSSEEQDANNKDEGVNSPIAKILGEGSLLPKEYLDEIFAKDEKQESSSKKEDKDSINDKEDTQDKESNTVDSKAHDNLLLNEQNTVKKTEQEDKKEVHVISDDNSAEGQIILR